MRLCQGSMEAPRLSSLGSRAGGDVSYAPYAMHCAQGEAKRRAAGQTSKQERLRLEAEGLCRGPFVVTI